MFTSGTNSVGLMVSALPDVRAEIGSALTVSPAEISCFSHWEIRHEDYHSSRTS